MLAQRRREIGARRHPQSAELQVAGIIHIREHAGLEDAGLDLVEHPRRQRAAVRRRALAGRRGPVQLALVVGAIEPAGLRRALAALLRRALDPRIAVARTTARTARSVFAGT